MSTVIPAINADLSYDFTFIYRAPVRDSPTFLDVRVYRVPRERPSEYHQPVTSCTVDK